VNGRKAEPWDTINTSKQLSKALGDSYSGIEQQLAKNADKVFQFADIYI
jgi:hypothetical protein